MWKLRYYVKVMGLYEKNEWTKYAPHGNMPTHRNQTHVIFSKKE